MRMVKRVVLVVEGFVSLMEAMTEQTKSFEGEEGGIVENLVAKKAGMTRSVVEGVVWRR